MRKEISRLQKRKKARFDCAEKILQTSISRYKSHRLRFEQKHKNVKFIHWYMGIEFRPKYAFSIAQRLAPASYPYS